jgi:hypothetical protein
MLEARHACVVDAPVLAKAKSLLLRVVANTLVSDKGTRLIGFPAQWIPLFVHFEIPFANPTSPTRYISFSLGIIRPSVGVSYVIAAFAAFTVPAIASKHAQAITTTFEDLPDPYFFQRRSEHWEPLCGYQVPR